MSGVPIGATPLARSSVIPGHLTDRPLYELGQVLPDKWRITMTPSPSAPSSGLVTTPPTLVPCGPSHP